MFKKESALHPDACTIIRNVLEYMSKEAISQRKQPFSSSYFQQTTVRVAKATKLSTGTVCNIARQGRRQCFNIVKSKSPRKKAQIVLDDFHYQHIRRIIYYLQSNLCTSTTITNVLAQIKCGIGFNIEIDLFRNILYELGFQTEGVNGQVYEKMKVRLKRMKYFDELKIARSLKRNIVYIGNIDVTTVHVKNEVEASTSQTKIKRIRKYNNHLIILNVVNESGLIPGTTHILKSKNQKLQKSSMEELNAETLKPWVIHQVLPNIIHESVVVLTTPYYIDLENKPPSLNDSREQMLMWLRSVESGCLDDYDGMTLEDIYKIVNLRLQKYPEYVIAQIFKDHGHSVVCLPRYYPDLNPATLILCEAKSKVKKLCTNCDLGTLKKELIKHISEYSGNKFNSIYDQVKDRELIVFQRDFAENIEDPKNTTITSEDKLR